MKNLSWGMSPPAKKNFARVWVLIHGYLRVRFDFPSFINFRDITGVSKLGAQNLISGLL